MPEVDTVLFDLGGVLTSDPWQSLILTPERGVADRLGIDRALASGVGSQLWTGFSRSPRQEAEYWSEFSCLVGRRVPAELVTEAEGETLETNSSWKRALAVVDERGLRCGFITDNTSFWYPKQLRLLGLSDRRTSPLDFASCEVGLSKSSPNRGLFEVAAESVEPGRALVIDDRKHNVDRAAACGFVTLHYSIHEKLDLVDAMELCLTR